MSRIVVAMSGGVDSSTVAGLLVEAGHDVIGLAMKTHGLEPRANRACCTPDDMRDARRIADHLNIPFYVLNYEEIFHKQIVQPFAQAYRDGQTPNPCVVCNDKVKFKPLLERARLLGADYLATGHYARIAKHVTGGTERLLLQRAVDSNKDQSYFLYRLLSEQIAQVMFPLGEMSKATVREHARRLGLIVADKSESQEICFVGAQGYAATVEKVLGESAMQGPAPGSIVDKDGRVLGRHNGVHHFTLGQRHGIGVSADHPLYVIDINGQEGIVRVGQRDALYTDHVVLRDVILNLPSFDNKTKVIVEQRYRGTQHPAHIELLDNQQIKVHFLEPTLRAAPGQAAVIYWDDKVIGGGTIMHPSNVRLPIVKAAEAQP